MNVKVKMKIPAFSGPCMRLLEFRAANFPGRTVNFPDRICMPRTTFAGVQTTSRGRTARDNREFPMLGIAVMGIYIAMRLQAYS